MRGRRVTPAAEVRNRRVLLRSTPRLHPLEVSYFRYVSQRSYQRSATKERGARARPRFTGCRGHPCLGQPLSSCYAIIPTMNSSTAPAGALTSIPTNPTHPKSSFARNLTLHDCDSSITGTHPTEEMEEKVKSQSFAANLNPSSPRSAITTLSRDRQMQEMPICQQNWPIGKFLGLEQCFLGFASPCFPPQIDLALLLARHAISRAHPRA